MSDRYEIYEARDELGDIDVFILKDDGVVVAKILSHRLALRIRDALNAGDPS